MPSVAAPPVDAAADDSPPSFLRLVGHPIRWRLLKELSRSDRAVRELTPLLDEKQSLVSYHLKELRDAGLVRSHRSSADGRDTYYAIDFVECRDLLQASGTALHPGLRLVADGAGGVGDAPGRRRTARRPKVLFLCTGNGTRSQIAAALLESLSDGEVDVVSAGSHPKPIHPNAVRVLAERGIDISDRSSTHLDRYTGRRFDHAITLCDRLREVCPEFPGSPDTAHWSIPDPGLEGDTDAATYQAFLRTADELATRIQFFLSAIHGPTRRSQP